MADLTQQMLDAAREGSERMLESSEGLEGKEQTERVRIQKSMLRRLIDYVDAAKEILGEPDGDTEAVVLWYPDALAAHAWTVDDGVYALSAVHKTNDAPIEISLRYVTKVERDVLSKNSPMKEYFDED